MTRYRTGPTRRELLRLGGGAGGLLLATSLGGTLSGCGFLSTDPEREGGSGAGGGGTDGNESPMLAELVESGDLPPLEERLPTNPMVVEPADRIGVFGDSFQGVVLGTGDTPWLGRTVGYEPLFRYTPDAKEIIPNFVESIEASDDGREFTIVYREGIKWSDGEPFSVDDVIWSWEEVIINSELHPIKPQYLTSDGELAQLEKVDDLSVRLTFPQPNGLFIEHCAKQGHLIGYPRHYMEQFHADHNPDAAQMADDEGHDDWLGLFWAKNDLWDNPDRPTVLGWVVTDPLGAGNRVVFERNPYYWKVDPEGNQLPYLDRMVFEIASEEQVILLKATSGQLDMTTRHINTLTNKPVLGDNREEGEYDFLTLENTVMNDMILPLNLDHKDEVLREVFREKDFRVALSLGIDREELSDAVWQQAGVPWQAAPDDRSRFYDEEFAHQYTEHDVDGANDLLDSLGLDERDDDGFRLRPDGKRLLINIQVANPALSPLWVDGANMVTQHWERIGVRGNVDVLDRTLFYERKAWDANEHDCAVWMGDGGLHIEIMEPRWYFPFTGESNYAPTWARWFETRGAEGVEPPDAPKEQMELYWELIRTPDADERDALFRRILEIAKEQFYAIGTVRVPDTYGIVKNDFHNVPEQFPESHVFHTPALANPETWFKE